MDVRKRLFELGDKKYRDFNKVIVPKAGEMIGVKIPELRKIAKELVKTPKWQNYKDALYFEEIMLQGLLIGYAKVDSEKRLRLIRDFIPKIDNWGICDIFCSVLKFAKKEPDLVWDFIQPYLNSDREFEIRFGVVMLLSYFIDDEHIDKVLKIIDRIKSEKYYVKMALAWAISICFVKHWDRTFEYFKNTNISKWVHNKAIQKTRESFRIPDDKKEILKKMRI